MIEVEQRLRQELEQLVPAYRPLDWNEVIVRADALHHTPPSRLRRRLAPVAALALAIGAAILLALSPWTVSKSFADRALAAVGSGRWVYAVIQTTSPYTRVVDLSVGWEARVTRQTVIVYNVDTHRGFWWTLGRRDLVTSGGPEPTLAGFLDGYRAALRKGSSRIVGTTTFRRRRATLLRFPTEPGDVEEVAVDDRTHRPLWFRPVHHGRPGNTFLVLRISTSSRRPPVPKPLPASAYIDGGSSKTQSIAPQEATRAFGRTALWPGRTIGTVTFKSAQLEHVTKIRLRHHVPLAHAHGVVFSYEGPKQWLDVSEETRPYAYEFHAYAGEPVLAADAILPPEGRVALSCDACGPGNHAPQYHPIWRAQLRVDGLYVRIRSWSRELVIAAARALRPTP